MPEPGPAGAEAAPQGAEAVAPFKDLRIRLLGIPAFGLTIPHLTGLFGAIGPGDPRYWVGLCWFVTLAALVWQGNRWLLFKQWRHLDWLERPAWKLVMLLVAVIGYTLPLSMVALRGWYAWAGVAPDWSAMEKAALMIVICVAFVTHAYETVFLIKARESDGLRVARLEQARSQAELDALRAQLDPHFLFNSLNALSYLIDTAPAAARRYNEALARVYRHLLAARRANLISLREELHFLEDYAALLRVRFGDALNVAVCGADDGGSQIVPVSLQVLLENAVKHNALSAGDPLEIEIRIAQDHVAVRNRLRPRSEVPPSGVGLLNLAERCRVVTGRSLEVSPGPEDFVVRVPLARGIA